MSRIFIFLHLFRNLRQTKDITENKSYVFSLTGETWSVIKMHYPELLSKVANRGVVFARMSPDQKQQLVLELQSIGYCVGKNTAHSADFIRTLHRLVLYTIILIDTLSNRMHA